MQVSRVLKKITRESFLASFKVISLRFRIFMMKNEMTDVVMPTGLCKEFC